MKETLQGAWMYRENNEEYLLQFADGYFTQTFFDKAGKKFIGTYGGLYTVSKSELRLLIEFDTRNKDSIGQHLVYHFSIKDNELLINDRDKETVYKKLDDGNAPLGGAWHITSQMREGQLVPIHRTGTRKTIKILSATRFQWIAIDPGIKEFYGTGGGTYRFEDGKYTEHIEFFSKDSNRVGASLSFEGKIESDDWHHSGVSTKGDRIYEIWSRIGGEH